MEGINTLLTIVFLLLLAFIGLLRAQTLLGVVACFILLTLVSYMTLYMFRLN
jgi:hypothetical protein